MTTWDLSQKRRVGLEYENQPIKYTILIELQKPHNFINSEWH
jgi:hypothetical protein